MYSIFSRILLTGATGFLGAHIQQELLARGHQVGCLVRPGRKGKDAPGVTWIEAETTTEAIVRSVAEYCPSLIIHCGGRVLTEHQICDVDDLVQSNLLFTTALCEAGSQCGGLRLINFGTCLESDETGALNPNSLYAATKSAAANIISYYCNFNAGAATTLQIPTIYGPGEKRPRLVRLLVEAALNGQQIDLSPGEQELDLLHVSDVVEAVILASKQLLKPKAVGQHKIQTITSGATVTPKQLVEIIENISGLKVRANWGARTYRKGERLSLRIDEDDLQDWMPKMKLQTGLSELIAATAASQPDCKLD